MRSSPVFSTYTKQRTLTTLRTSAFRSTRPTFIAPFQRRYVSEDIKERELEEETANEPIAPETTSAEEIDLSEIEPAKPEQSSSEQDSPYPDESRVVTETQSAGPSAQDTPVADPDQLFPPSNSVYVGNLFYDVTEDILRQELGKCGPIKGVKIILDHRGLSKGFAFVEFEDGASAQRAIDNHNLRVLEGRRITVQFAARPRAGPGRTNPGRPLPHDPLEPSTTLFVGNISYEVSDKDLNSLFRPLKNATEIRVAIDRRTGQPRGFAHVDFSDIPSAETAKAILGNKIVLGRRLRVDFAAASTQPRGNSGQRSNQQDVKEDE